MKEVHFVLQGKGGVGKSLISVLLAQYFMSNVDEVHCFDTDPVNQTFSRFSLPRIQQIDILTPQKTIDSRKFDGLIESLVELDGVAVVDNGAATFVPLMGYLKENNVVSLLREMGIKMILHVPVVGGQASEDTAIGLNSVAMEGVDIYVWANHYWGEVAQEGKPVNEWGVVKKLKDNIKGIIHLKQYNPDTFGKDISKMTTEALTLDEAIKSAAFGLMSKQRLKTFKRDVFSQIDEFYQPTGDSE